MAKTKIQLSDHFTFGRLLRFTFPSIIMMIFTSIYSIVDGLFVSNFVGKTSFAAVNFIMPFIMIFNALGFMVGSGGSALVSRTLGEGDEKKANERFSLLIYSSIVLGIFFTVLALVLLRPIAKLLGADGQLLEDCVLYGSTVLPFITVFMLQSIFQAFVVVAERPTMGLVLTVCAGVTNMVLDALFVGLFGWGLRGAAIATGMSFTVGGLIPLVYFIAPNKSRLRLGSTKIVIKDLLKAYGNGASELMTNLSASIVNMLYNYQLTRYAGVDGIAAYGVIMYVCFIYIGVFVGFTSGSAPLVGYHFGAGNHEELRNLKNKGLVFQGTAGIILTALSQVLAYPLAYIFTSYDAGLLAMTTTALRLYSLSFLLCPFNIYGSGFFTALNNGFVSAMISFLRLFVFQTLSILVLPLIFRLNGIWLAISVAELLSLCVTFAFFKANKKKYHY